MFRREFLTRAFALATLPLVATLDRFGASPKKPFTHRFNGWTFYHREVDLTNGIYDGCTFHSCTLIGDHFELHNCTITNQVFPRIAANNRAYSRDQDVGRSQKAWMDFCEKVDADPEKYRNYAWEE